MCNSRSLYGVDMLNSMESCLVDDASIRDVAGRDN